jgi:chemotaxis protein MotB
MARKPKHEEHENHERWLVSYADFITLLFAFFVVMYSLSAVNEGKFRVLAESLVAAFSSTPKSLQPVQSGQPAKAPAPPIHKLDPIAPVPAINPVQAITPPVQQTEAPRLRAIREMADDIERAMGPLIKADLLVVRRDTLWLEVEIKTSILYPSGSAQLQPQAVPVLNEIATILGRFPNPIHVEGFTDNVPISTTAFPSNWELSAGRAATVVHLFMGAGIKPERMAAIGLGEYRPIADNTTEEGRNKNRRVVIVVLADGEAGDLLQATPAAVDGAVSPPAGTSAPSVPGALESAPASVIPPVKVVPPLPLSGAGTGNPPAAPAQGAGGAR